MSKIQKNHLNKGFTLIEVLIAISLVAFSLIAILSAFIVQGQQNNSINERNVAIVLAEEKLEEYFKFPYTDMPNPTTQVDYIYYHLNRDPVNVDTLAETGALGGRENIFERTVTTNMGIDLSTIDVVVRYGYQVKSNNFLFSVNFSTSKGE